MQGYYILFWMLIGQTPGKYLMGLRIVRLDGSRVTIGVCIRRLIGYYISAILFIGYIMVLFDDRRQAFHDKFAGTFVIYAWSFDKKSTAQSADSHPRATASQQELLSLTRRPFECEGARMQRDLVRSAPRLTAEDALRLVADLYGLYGEPEALPSERDQNFRIATEDGAEYVLKIANASEDLAALDLQNRAMVHVAAKAAAADLDSLCPHLIWSADGQEIATVALGDGDESVEHFVRLLTYLPGKPLALARPQSPRLYQSLGRVPGPHRPLPRRLRASPRCA